MKRQLYALLFIALTATACNKAKAAYEKPLTPVGVTGAQIYTPSGAENAGTRYSATIKPSMQLDLAGKQGGFVTELLQVGGRNVQEGDWVAKNSVLVRLRSDEFANKINGAESQISEAQAALTASQSQVAEAESSVRQTLLDLERATALLESASLTRPEYDTAKTRNETAQARLAAARAQTQVIQARINIAKTVLAEAQLAQQDSVIRAPFDCFVLKRNVERGSLVAPGTPLLTVAGSGEVKAVFGVADLSVSKLRQGMNLNLTTEALPGIEFKGWLTRIAASADSRTRVFEVELTIPKPPSQLRAGMIASLVVPDANATAKPVVVVPLNAVVSHPRQAGKEDSYTVVVVTGDKNNAVARRRTVKLGEAFGNLIAISEGLEAGESVVTLGAATVNDGERVQVIQ